jgi:hypothetical protein
MAAHAVALNLADVRAEIAEACLRAGRPADAAALLVVSKTFPPEQILPAVEAGQRLFGENRVQECQAKAPALPAHLEWHMIGHLQTNKVRKVLPLVRSIHSVDSLELAQAISRIAGELGLHPEIYLQVNVSADAAKFGFSVEQVHRALPEILALPHLSLRGLMTIPELTLTPEQARPHFAALRLLRDALETQAGVPLPGLSMGMSGDFPQAIAEGATLVRVGSRIFGGR